MLCPSDHPQRSPSFVFSRFFFFLGSSEVVRCVVPLLDDGLAVSSVDSRRFSERLRGWSIEQIEVKQEQDYLSALLVL